MTVSLVCMSDTHMFHDDLKAIPDADVLVHAGDLTRGGTAEELQQACAFLRALPHQHKIVIAGNHDWLFLHEPERARKLLDGLTYLQDSGVELAGLHFWGSPWQPEYGRWAFNLPPGPALATKWALIPDDTDVLITHGPPYGILDDASGYRHGEPAGSCVYHAGCRDLLERVRVVKPRVHIFGHIHCNRGVFETPTTLFVNASTDEGELDPLLLVLDLD